MGDIVFRAAARIELLGMPDQITQPPLQFGPTRQHLGLVQQDRQRVRNRAILDDKGAVHEDFTKPQFGVEENAAFGVSSHEPDRYRFTGPVAAGEFCSARGRERHCAAANELAQEITQQTVHRNHQRAIP